MPLSQEAIQLILGIKETFYLRPEEMAKHLKVTFFPVSRKTSKFITIFSEKLKKTLIKLGVEILPYEQTLVPIRNMGKRIKPGIAVIAIDENETGKLPIDNTTLHWSGECTESPIPADVLRQSAPAVESSK